MQSAIVPIHPRYMFLFVVVVEGYGKESHCFTFYGKGGRVWEEKVTASYIIYGELLRGMGRNDVKLPKCHGFG